MKGVNGCPYCGGEVEVVKLTKKKRERGEIYRIECRKCRKLVARGVKFEIESKEEGAVRIKQYKAFIKDKTCVCDVGMKRNNKAAIRKDGKKGILFGCLTRCHDDDFSWSYYL